MELEGRRAAMRAVLTYHSIDDSGSPISVHPQTFARHMAWLASGRVRVTTVDELARLPDDVDAVALTFDDAFENFGTQAAPLLRAHGLPVTLFVVTDRAGGTNRWHGRVDDGIPVLPLLDWPALERLAASGVSLGAHTRTHPDLTALGPAALHDEIDGSADVLHSRTGTRPTAFAYPYGRLTPDVARCASARFTWACTTEFSPLHAGTDAAMLPRLDMYYFRRAGALEAWGTARFDRQLAIVRQRRRWRRLLTNAWTGRA